MDQQHYPHRRVIYYYTQPAVFFKNETERTVLLYRTVVTTGTATLVVSSYLLNRHNGNVKGLIIIIVMNFKLTMCHDSDYRCYHPHKPVQIRPIRIVFELFVHNKHSH